MSVNTYATNQIKDVKELWEFVRVNIALNVVSIAPTRCAQIKFIPMF